MGRAERVLVLAHVFPRTLDDSMGAFLLHLADGLAGRGIMTHVVAPHAPGLVDVETLGTVPVRRFHYAPSRWERLASAGQSGAGSVAMSDIITVQHLRGDGSEPLVKELGAFCRSVERRSAPPVTGEDGLQAVRLATTILERVGEARA